MKLRQKRANRVGSIKERGHENAVTGVGLKRHGAVEGVLKVEQREPELLLCWRFATAAIEQSCDISATANELGSGDVAGHTIDECGSGGA